MRKPYSVDSRQRNLAFPSQRDELVVQNEPPFKRDTLSPRPYTGMSPRDVFEHFLNVGEIPQITVVTSLNTYIGKKRSTIRHLLSCLENGRYFEDQDMQQHAYLVKDVMDTLNNLELAWHLYEMNLTRLKNDQNIFTPYRKLIHILHCQMGALRTKINALLAK